MEMNCGFNTLTIELRPEAAKKSRTVRIVQYPDWPEKAVPSSYRDPSVAARHRRPGRAEPGADCDALPGWHRPHRTMILTLWTLNRLYAGENVQMFDLLRQLRDQRAMAVQNERQLMLVYLCCLEYITRKGSVDEHDTRDGMDKSILMLCELVEQNKPKCTKYCPDEAGQEMTFQTADQGPITVRCEQDADFKFRKETKAKIRVRTLKVNGLGLEEPLTVRHYH
ncbi:unnamed protein product, partial [Mesorhabditis spiculigera]